MTVEVAVICGISKYQSSFKVMSKFAKCACQRLPLHISGVIFNQVFSLHTLVLVYIFSRRLPVSIHFD